jgi:hypothetical protein
MYTPHICAASIVEVCKNMLSIHLKMFYSYTRCEHKKIFDRFIHQINAPVLVNISLEKFCCRKETWGYAKEKKKTKEELKKMDTKRCLEY